MSSKVQSVWLTPGYVAFHLGRTDCDVERSPTMPAAGSGSRATKSSAGLAVKSISAPLLVEPELPVAVADPSWLVLLALLLPLSGHAAAAATPTTVAAPIPPTVRDDRSSADRRLATVVRVLSLLIGHRPTSRWVRWTVTPASWRNGSGR